MNQSIREASSIDEVDDATFVAMIQRAMSELSPDHIQALEHVAILVADEPTPEQARALQLRGDQLLLGLFEGVPRTHRGGNESGLAGDTITIFKQGLLAVSRDEDDLYQQVKRTVWHEIAHYYGLSHDHMDALQQRD